MPALVAFDPIKVKHAQEREVDVRSVDKNNDLDGEN